MLALNVSFSFNVLENDQSMSIKIIRHYLNFHVLLVFQFILSFDTILKHYLLKFNRMN